MDNGTVESVILCKFIPFWRTAFLIRDILMFSKDKLCWLSLRDYWVNLVRASVYAIKSSRSMLGEKRMVK